MLISIRTPKNAFELINLEQKKGLRIYLTYHFLKL